MPMYLSPIKCKHFPHTCFKLLFVKKQAIQVNVKSPVLPSPVSPCSLPLRRTQLSCIGSCTILFFILLNFTTHIKHAYYIHEPNYLHIFQVHFFFTLGVECGTLAIATFTTKHFVFRTCYTTLVRLFKLLYIT